MAKHWAQISGGARPAEGASYETRPLDASTWDAFAELVERNNGVYGGCWFIARHFRVQRGVSDPRTLKEELVKAGRAHAALVFDEDDLARGWCRYGSAEELGLKHLRDVREETAASGALADRLRLRQQGPSRPRRREGGAGGRTRPDRRRRRRVSLK